MNETDSPPQFILLYYFIILLLFVISNVVKRWRFFVRFLGDTKDIIDKYRIQKIGFSAMKWRKITLITYVRRIQIVPID